MINTDGPIGIFNLALSHLATGLEVQSWTDSTKEAGACRRFYDLARRKVLRAFPWPFATQFVSVTLVGGTAAQPVTPEWGYSYRLPPDWLRIVRILNGQTRRDTQRTKVPYRVMSDGTGGLLYTDFPPTAASINAAPLFSATPVTTPPMPMIEYIWDFGAMDTVDSVSTSGVGDTSKFSPDFEETLSFLLAYYIAPRVTKGDQTKLGDRAWGNYQRALQLAASMAINEEGADPPAQAEWITARE